MGQFLVRLKKLYESINKSIEIFKYMKRDPELLLREHYSKNESWKSANSVSRKLNGTFYFFYSGTVEKLSQWLGDHGILDVFQS